MFLDRDHFISCSTKTPVDSLSNIQNNYDIILELSGACERSGRQLDHEAIGPQEPIGSFVIAGPLIGSTG